MPQPAILCARMNAASSGELDTSPKNPLTNSTAISARSMAFAQGYLISAHPPRSRQARTVASRWGRYVRLFCLFRGRHYIHKLLNGVGGLSQLGEFVGGQIELYYLGYAAAV